jgi:ATP-binding cassette subfamily F protein uup
VIDAVTEIAEDIVLDNGMVRLSPMQFLQRFLFSPADQQKYIHTLSGGERCRLHLATVLMRQPNFLILDEPTNDLDIVTLGILEEYLSEYKGCLIVVSHDRYFLDNIVDHLFVMQGQGVVKDFPGNYSEYREWIDEENRRQAAEARVDVKPEPNVNRHQQRPPKMSFKEKQEFEALSVEIEQLTAEKKALDDLFNSGEMIDDIAAKSARYNQLQELLDEKEMRWLELSEKS